MNENLKFKTVKNIGFNAFASAAQFLLSAGASIILAQKLSAGDYGVVGFAMIFINFLSRFSDLGITQAVIRKSQLDNRGLYTGYTTKFFLGIVLFVVIFFISPIAKYFIDNSAVETVIKVLSTSFIINTFGFLPTCLLTRELNFKKLIIPQLSSAVTNSGVSIILALSGLNYWSIVIANVASTLISVLVVNVIRPTKVRLFYDKKIFREFIGFGGNLFLAGFLMFLLFNADNFVVGSVTGSVGLGLYSIAFNWGSMICGRLYEIVHNVLFPTFSRIQNDKDKLRESYLKVLEFVTFIGVIVNLTLLLCSKEFLYFILGHSTNKWMPALTTFRIMLIYGVIRTFLEPVANVILSLGKSRLLLKANLIAGSIELGLLYPMAKYYGVEGVAVLVTISYSVQYIIYFPFLKKEINLKYNDIWSIVKPAMISTVFLSGATLIYNDHASITLVSFTSKILLGVIGYFLFYGLMTRWKLFKEAVAIVGGIKTS